MIGGLTYKHNFFNQNFLSTQDVAKRSICLRRQAATQMETQQIVSHKIQNF